MRINFKVLFDGILLAFQLLTMIPITKQLQWDDIRAKASVATYPLVGIFLGIFMAVQLFLLIEYTAISSIILAAWLITISILFSGGLHLDGWADFHDAVFSRRSRDRKLEIMKDPRIGTFGVLSLLFVISWRFIFILEIIRVADASVIYAVFLLFVLTRLLIGWQLLLGHFARPDGMAVALQPAKEKGMMIIYCAWTFGILVLLLLSNPMLLWLFIGAGFFLVMWHKWVKFQLGGITGDTIGAGVEGGETFLWGILWFLLLLDMV